MMRNIFILILFFLFGCAEQNQNSEIKDTYDKPQEISLGSSAPIIAEPPQPKIKKIKSINVDDYFNGVGDITHRIKDTMTYFVTDTIELTISYKMPIGEIIDEVGTFSKSNVTTQKIKITPLMKAKLIDPNDSFIITPITDSIQIVEVDNPSYTLWQWRVTPVKGGENFLVINVDMIVGDHLKSLKIYENKIYVHIKPITKIWNNIKNNWTYITYILGVIGTIITWIYKDKIISLFKK